MIEIRQGAMAGSLRRRLRGLSKDVGGDGGEDVLVRCGKVVRGGGRNGASVGCDRWVMGRGPDSRAGGQTLCRVCGLGVPCVGGVGGGSAASCGYARRVNVDRKRSATGSLMVVAASSTLGRAWLGIVVYLLVAG